MNFTQTGFLKMSIHLCLLQQFKTRISVFFKKHISDLSPYWSALYFWQIDFEKSSWTNWIFCLFRTWFLLCSLKILVWNRQKFKFVQLDFSNQISKIKIRSIGGMSLFAHVSIPWDHCNVCGLQQREHTVRKSKNITRQNRSPILWYVVLKM